MAVAPIERLKEYFVMLSPMSIPLFTLNAASTHSIPSVEDGATKSSQKKWLMVFTRVSGFGLRLCISRSQSLTI